MGTPKGNFLGNALSVVHIGINISSEKKAFQTEFIGFSHPETGAHMAEILIDEAIKVVIPYLN